MNRHRIRKSKLEKALMQALNQIVLFEMDDERLKREMITLTRVELNEDFSQASFFFTSHHPDKKNKIVKIFYSSIPYFRSLLAQKVMIKNIPQLKFFYDYNKGEDVAALIDHLSIQYRKDKEKAESQFE